MIPTTNDKELAGRLGIKTVATMDASRILVEELIRRGLYLTTVESCTGGALAHYITSTPGSGDMIKDAFVTYSNEAKVALGVPKEVIDKYTVYSTQAAVAMARAGVDRSVRADIGVGITGSLSRTDPDNKNSIIGEVYIGIVFGDQELGIKLQIPEESRMEAKLHIVNRCISEINNLLG